MVQNQSRLSSKKKILSIEFRMPSSLKNKNLFLVKSLSQKVKLKISLEIEFEKNRVRSRIFP